MHRSLGTLSASEMFPSGLPSTRTARQVVASFLKIAEGVAHRWIETRKGVLLLQMAPYQPDSGEIYIYDRLRDMWFLLSFEHKLDGFSVETFEKVYREYRLLAYVEQPGLLENLLERRRQRNHTVDRLTSAAIGEVLNHARDLVSERNGDFTQAIALAQADDDPLGTTWAFPKAARVSRQGSSPPHRQHGNEGGDASLSCCQRELRR